MPTQRKAKIMNHSSDSPTKTTATTQRRSIRSPGSEPRLTVEELAAVGRREAIRLALRSAEPGDVVLVAGKGHEDYQINGDEVRHFSDRETVEAVLEELRA